MDKYFDISRVRLLPKECAVSSRDECDTSVNIGGLSFKVPVVPSNMMCTISEDLCIELAKRGYFYIMHRFGHDNVKFVLRANAEQIYKSISVGTNQEYYDQLKRITALGIDLQCVTIDIAHGHSPSVVKMAQFIRDNFKDCYIIGGNVCTPDGVRYLQDHVDAVKIDIGSGSSCTTFHTTQFGSRGWNGKMLEQCAEIAKCDLILDGGIKTIGEMVASTVLGAKMVMAGGIMSGFSDSPGEEVFGEDGKVYKEFFGSSSEWTKGHKKYVEGRKYLMEKKNKTLLDFYEEIAQGFRSAISYGGGRKLEDLRRVEWIVVD